MIKTKNFYNGTYKEFLKETGLDQVNGYFKGSFDEFEEMIGTTNKSYNEFSNEQLLAVYEFWREYIGEPEMLIIERMNLEGELDDDDDNFDYVLDQAVEILKHSYR